MAIKILKISCMIAWIVLTVAFVIWGLRITEAVGNLYVEVKALEQRVSILTSTLSEKNRGTNGASKDEVQ